MIKTFTQTDLIRYLYKETTEEEKSEIDKALIRDSELKTLFNELRAMLNDLNSVQLEPSNNVVLNILSYSKSLQEKR